MRVRRSSQTAFTFVELVMSIIILSVCAIPIALLHQQASLGSHQARVVTIATALAEEKLEEVLRLGFSGVSDTGLSNFPDPFSGYSFRINVDYVEEADLNAPVVYATNHKSIEVQVSHNLAPVIIVKSLLTD